MLITASAGIATRSPATWLRRRPPLDRVREPPQLRGQQLRRIVLLDVALALGCHRYFPGFQ
jgi:hypothetical protein